MKKVEEKRGLSYRRVFFPEERESWYRARFQADLFEPRSSHPEAELVHETSKSRVFRIADAESSESDRTKGGARKLFLKEERYEFPVILQTLLTRARVAREFDNLMVLRSLGCPAVEPLACGISGWGPFHRRSFLITAEFARARTLKDWSRGRLGRRARPDRRERRCLRVRASPGNGAPQGLLLSHSLCQEPSRPRVRGGRRRDHDLRHTAAVASGPEGAAGRRAHELAALLHGVLRPGLPGQVGGGVLHRPGAPAVSSSLSGGAASGAAGEELDPVGRPALATSPSRDPPGKFQEEVSPSSYKIRP